MEDIETNKITFRINDSIIELFIDPHKFVIKTFSLATMEYKVKSYVGSKKTLSYLQLLGVQMNHLEELNIKKIQLKERGKNDVE